MCKICAYRNTFVPVLHILSWFILCIQYKFAMLLHYLYFAFVLRRTALFCHLTFFFVSLSLDVSLDYRDNASHTGQYPNSTQEDLNSSWLTQNNRHQSVVVVCFLLDVKGRPIRDKDWETHRHHWRLRHRPRRGQFSAPTPYYFVEATWSMGRFNLTKCRWCERLFEYHFTDV